MSCDCTPSLFTVPFRVSLENPFPKDANLRICPVCRRFHEFHGDSGPWWRLCLHCRHALCPCCGRPRHVQDLVCEDCVGFLQDEAEHEARERYLPPDRW